MSFTSSSETVQLDQQQIKVRGITNWKGDIKVKN